MVGCNSTHPRCTIRKFSSLLNSDIFIFCYSAAKTRRQPNLPILFVIRTPWMFSVLIMFGDDRFIASFPLIFSVSLIWLSQSACANRCWILIPSKTISSYYSSAKSVICAYFASNFVCVLSGLLFCVFSSLITIITS